MKSNLDGNPGKIKPLLLRNKDLELPHEILVDLMTEVLARGASFQFHARGNSMSPFIRSGELLTIVPLAGKKLRLGDVVAYFIPQTQKLVVHRIVAKDGSSYLIKGDNSAFENDGWIPKKHILGLITQSQQGDQKCHFGLGPERLLIAFLSRHALLTRILRRLRRIGKKIRGSG